MCSGDNIPVMLGSLFFCISLMLFSSCQGGERTHDNAMYFWRTTFELDSTETAFLHEQDIRRLYVRFFDVALNTQQQSVPVGTCSFKSRKPDHTEIIPTVFIMENCLWQDTTALATNLVRRVMQMTETNDMGPMRELQVDCDYTIRSRQRYYDILKRMRHQLQQHGIRLSATIRLHQLGMEAPPVDEGVLMVYNTGDVTKRSERNPILDLRDVKPYLKRLDRYPLPLTAAYPIFDWRVLFHNNTFRHIAYNEPDAQCKLLGDTLLHWHCTTDDILCVKQEIDKHRSNIHRQVTLYHLDGNLIKNYKKEDYEKIFSE